MKRTLLMLVVAGVATLIGGAVKEDRITVLEAKALPLRLPLPTQGYQPFTPSDVIFIRRSTERSPLP